MSLTELIVGSAWRGTVLLLCGFAAAYLLRRSSAARRHFVWTATMAALLALPAALLPAPRWYVKVAALTVRVAATPAPAPRVPVRPVPWILAIWTAGALSAGGWFLAGAARVTRMVRQSAPGPQATDLRVVEGECIPVPMAWGIFRPLVLLPRAAREWPEERLRSAILHEGMHLRRRDPLIQLLAQAVCSLYWFHPLVWLAARELRKERERACDDAVLLTGLAAPEYAGHLMALALELAGHRIEAPAMAERSDLESRVRALLDRRRNRRPLNRRAAGAIASGFLAVLLAVTIVRAQAPAVSDVISGTVLDPRGARIQGCHVIARNLDGSNREMTTVTGPTGAYQFDTLPTGQYLLEFQAPGFKSTLVMARSTEQYVTLALGSVSESVVVGGHKPAVVGAAPQPESRRRIRVGGNVQSARLISQPPVVYPAELQQFGIEGSVVIRAVISATGEPADLQVMNTIIDPRLAQAAVDSVRQWRYQPALLNGEPIPIDTTVTVDFKLKP